MGTVLVIALLTLAIVAGAAIGIWLRRRVIPNEPQHEIQPTPFALFEADAECMGDKFDPEQQRMRPCMKELPAAEVHRLIDRIADEEESKFAGGTAMVAEFCAVHCPGGCSLGCSKRRRKSA